MLPASGTLKTVSEYEKQLADDIGQFYNDPLGFVKYVFPWGEGELKDCAGPDIWQTDLLTKMGEELRKTKDTQTALRMAVASGHGVGKTALTSWLVLWFMSTRPKCQVVVTANTAAQLTTKTWRELSKWSRLALNRHWWVWTATAFYHTLYPELWRASATPWSKDNSEAFAGTHETSGVLFLFDEGSGIDDIIYEVSEGAMTTSGAVWCVFGNPTRTSGKFHECFHSMKHRWFTYQVDSRNAKMTNKAQIAEWIADYGEDSDFVKVRVKGEFPRQSASQFISADLVLEAIQRKMKPDDYRFHPLVIGVDVARFGNDQSVILKRQGHYVFPEIVKRSGLNNMELAGLVVELYRKSQVHCIVCVDGVGNGSGVVDRLKQLGINTIDVQSAEKAFDPKVYVNRRSEMWGRMRDWLVAGGKLPNDKDLEKELIAPEFSSNRKLQIVLQSKDDIRKSLGYSPDIADALAFTFAYDEMRHIAAMGKARPIKQVTWT